MADYQFKELQSVCKSLNTVLTKAKAIKYVGVKADDVVKSFTKNVMSFANKGKVDDLPDNVVDFFNKHFGEEDTSKGKKKDKKAKKKEKEAAQKKKDADKKKVADQKKKDADKKKKDADKKKAADQKKKDAAKKKKAKKPGIVACAVALYMEKGVTKVKDLEKRLEKKFPDAKMTATLGHVVCVLNHVKKKED